MRKMLRKSIGLLVAMAMVITLMPLGTLSVALADPGVVTLVHVGGTLPGQIYSVNIVGSVHEIKVDGWDPVTMRPVNALSPSDTRQGPWVLSNVDTPNGAANAYIVAYETDASKPQWVKIRSTNWGTTHILFNYEEQDAAGNWVPKTANTLKKWAKLCHTILKDDAGNILYDSRTDTKDTARGGQSEIRWDENLKKWVGEEPTIHEYVYGKLPLQDGSWETNMPLQHVPVTWTLETEPVPGSVTIISNTGPTDVNGHTMITLQATATGTTTIMAEAGYPIGVQETPIVEWTEWSWYAIDAVKIPRIKWAGEEIVLEKKFGARYAGLPATFYKDQNSPGHFDGPGGTADSYSTLVGADGIAQASFMSEQPGEVDIDVILYFGPFIINKHGFVVFYLKYEDIGLRRIDPADPTQTGVSTYTSAPTAEQLLRTRVRGWFVGDDLSTRLARTVSGQVLPAGRWILPDDWAKLAMNNQSSDPDDWEAFRAAWDLHDNKADVTAGWMDPVFWYADGDVPFALPGEELGPTGDPALWPVIGPYDPLRPETIFPNGRLNKDDAPMPAAKVKVLITDKADLTTFTPTGEVFADTDTDLNGNGVIDYSEKLANEWGKLKRADKGLIFSTPGTGLPWHGPNTAIPDRKFYAAFYRIWIPDHPLIPPYINNGGYMWDRNKGPYDFWTITNSDWAYRHSRPEILALKTGYPKQVQVYSDEHGEAMVWLNSNNPSSLPQLTRVRSYADYPYLRKHPPARSGNVYVKWQ